MRNHRHGLMLARRTDGKLVGRPLSPHLQVYRWPISMVLSISHRITGVALSLGALFMTWWLVAAATSDSSFDTVQYFLGSTFGTILLLGWAGALVLHFFQGIRHLMWDAGWGFGILATQEPVSSGSESRIYSRSGWSVVGLTVIATLILWIVGFVAWR